MHDPVMFYTKDGAAPFTYYRQRLGAPMTEAQTMRLDAPPSKEQIAEWAARYSSITVVRFPALKQDPVDIKMTDAFTNEYRLCERRALKGLSVSWFVKGDCPAEP